ncbi:hypothetical protein C3492_32795 [Streptomyces sp. Ru62]|uniref:hypothetical protein n=1 Tax=Streptomyces sp. Ru62 TaxID=2080745 RepID=UPI000CDDF6B0|nr:hypothetical protein [Streptomyces sp. Ru62]POX59372.1 hypothetical protein C3492_32795 [Streptomyces sp. Ru62]
MGERHSGGGLTGRRRAHPGGAVATPDPADASGLETRLAAALRADRVDAEAERSAVAAFRAARDAGAHDARTRARDDWRPGRPAPARRPLRTTLSVALASLTLGGVAVAAIGSAGSGTHDDDRSRAPRSTRPVPGTPPVPADATAAGPSATASEDHPGRPATARDTLAHCRAYTRAGDRGGALESAAWQRLVSAAGGPEKVAAYCAARMAEWKQGKNADNADNADSAGSSGNKGNGGTNGGGTKGNSGNGESKGGGSQGNAAVGNSTEGNPTGGKAAGRDSSGGKP